MSANSNLRVESTSEDRLIRQVIAVCAKHGVPFGSPDDLRGFLRHIDTNKHLAMDFWSMVARMTEHGPTGDPDRLLRIIAEGVTSHTLTDLRAMGASQQVPLQQLSGMLAGEDVRPVAAADRKPVRAAQEPEPAPAPTPPRRATPPPPTFLLQQSPPTRSSAAPALPPDAVGRRLMLEPDPPAHRTASAAASRRESPDEAPHWVIPLEAYSDKNKKSWLSGGLIGGLLFTAVLAGSAVFVVRNKDRVGNSLRAGMSSAVDTWKGTHTVQPLESGNPSATANAANPLGPSIAGTLPPAPQAQPPQSIAAGPTPAAQSASAATAPETASQPVSAPNNADATTDDTRASNAPVSSAGGSHVVVPEILMNPNLVSSHEPTPVYNHARGRVVMQ
ncbi:MAG TPA: hypothetical protein VGN01_15465, partial [Acidobacteriaceae bacterium]